MLQFFLWVVVGFAVLYALATAMIRKSGHPHGLTTLFFTEMWERFSYYGMRAILMLFMTTAVVNGGLGFGADKAGPIYAMYTSMVYLATVPGGWLADNFLGQRRSVLLGGIVIMIGHILLALHGINTFYAGLACVVIGTGLLKPNISVIVGQLYTQEDKRRDAGFSMFYMGINVGAFSAPLICGFLAQSPTCKAFLEGLDIDPARSWHWGFAAAAVGMFFGLVQYLLTGHKLGDAGLRPSNAGDPASVARSRRTLAIGVAAFLALMLGAFLVDRGASRYGAIRWEPAEGGLRVTAVPIGGGTPVALNAGQPIAAKDLERVLGEQVVAALREEVFAQRVAADIPAGSNNDVFFRAEVNSDEIGLAENDCSPGSQRIGRLRWEPSAGGVQVFAGILGHAAEIPLGELAPAASGERPDRVKPAIEPILESVLASSVASGATSGELTGIELKQGGLNRHRINLGFTVILILIVVGFFARLFLAGEWTPAERGRLVLIFVLFSGAAIFWGIFEQAGSTLTLFAERSTCNALFGLAFPSSWWQSVNAALIVILAPFFAWIWLALSRRGRDPSYPTKFAVGLLFAGLGFAVLIGGASMAKGGVEVSPLWLLSVYLLHTIGELCLSPVGLSSMTKLAPVRVVSLMMGVWFLASSVGNFIGGSVSGFYERFELPTLFAMVATSGGVMALIMFALVVPIKRMMARTQGPSGTGGH